MTETAAPKRRRTSVSPDEPEIEFAPETAPDKTPYASPRAKDAPRTMRDLRLARHAKKKVAAKPDGNPLREGLRLERVPDPSTLVLFGATGDLAHRKVIPALYQLWRTNLLPHEFVILAIGRRPYDDDTLRADLRTSLEKFSRVLPLDEAAWRSFSSRIRYQRMDFDDPASLRRPRHDARGRSTRTRTPVATTSTTSRRSRRRSPRSSASWAGSASTTSTTRAAGGGSSSRSRSATT